MREIKTFFFALFFFIHCIVVYAAVIPLTYTLNLYKNPEKTYFPFKGLSIYFLTQTFERVLLIWRIHSSLNRVNELDGSDILIDELRRGRQRPIIEMVSHHQVSQPFLEFYLLATLDASQTLYNKVVHGQCPLIDAIVSPKRR